VRMIMPPVAERRAIDRDLSEYFRTHRQASFKRAISQLCRYFNVKRPRVEWYEYIDWGKTAGKTFEDGKIILVHPENWKRGRIYNTERMWIQIIYHEMGHYLFWTDAERKADAFMRRMVIGLRPASTRNRRVRRGIMCARRSPARSRRRKFRAGVRARQPRRARRPA